MTKQLIIKSDNYSLYKLDKQHLYEIAKFVVEENHKHNFSKTNNKINIEEKIEAVYQEELIYADNSDIFIAENNNCCIIGCIRVMKWNMKHRLPMHKTFGINPLEHITTLKNTTFWHIGRFAISNCLDISNGRLFKQLMIYAIYQIYQEEDGYMIAECDSRLLQIINILGINTISLGKGLQYLYSETIPIYANKTGLSKFYQNFIHLHHKYQNKYNPIKVA